MTNTAARITRQILDAIATHHYRAGHPERARWAADAFHRLPH